jgi:hypothetical protein
MACRPTKSRQQKRGSTSLRRPQPREHVIIIPSDSVVCVFSLVPDSKPSPWAADAKLNYAQSEPAAAHRENGRQCITDHGSRSQMMEEFQ